ncbi:MAG: T9SS type A sorting domain-containing protein [Ignavibacteriaceae bacterium]
MKASKLFLILAVLFISAQLVNAQIISANDGGWNQTATWVGGVVPGSSDNVVIDHTVTLDVTDAVCNDLTLNNKLRFAIDGTVSGITVNGNIIINSGGLLRVESLSASGAFVEHTMNLKGDLTNNGTLDFRGGSNGSGTSNGVLLTLEGTTNSTVSLINTTYSSSNEEFNSITINKSGGAKVILASGNLFMSNNASTGGVVLTLTDGIIETGSNQWVLLRTGSSGIVGGSDNSYVNGILGRGVSNGGGQVEIDFPVGEGMKYRPISFSFDAPANSTGHYFWVQMISGNANTGSSTFTGGINKVSELRYYEAGYLQNNGSASAESVFQISPTYSTDDSVIAGNQDLRVAYSLDNRTTWNGAGPTDHTTDLTNVPTTIASDSLNPNISIPTGSSIFISLAYATGGVNPVTLEGSSIVDRWYLDQNYPNPFNPSTIIKYGMPSQSNVRLIVYNIIGEVVTELVNEIQSPGNYSVKWDASNVNSGVYFIKIKADNFVSIKKMLLIK